MNDARANSPTLEADETKPPNESWLAEPKPLDEGWPWRKMVLLVALAIAAHVALIYFFGTKKQIVPRLVANVPHLQLARSDDELIELGNPTLFALPNPKDFSSAIWSKIPVIATPLTNWTEPPQWLPLNPKNLGAMFRRFMQTNRLAKIQLDLKPSVKLIAPAANLEPAPPQNSTLKILGALAQRGLRQPVTLPSLPYNNVIPPSKIQALVDADGNVISAVLLPSNNSFETTERYDLADQRALELARGLPFEKNAQLTLGEIIFNWHTVPAPATNAPANP